MKKKINEISNKEMKEICQKQNTCTGCPFERYKSYEKIGKIKVMCHLKLRAIMLLNIAEFKRLYTVECENLQKEYYLDQYNLEIQNLKEIGEDEIEL